MANSKPKKKNRKVKRRVRISKKIAIVRKDSVQRDSARNDTLPKAPFIMNDNELNMRIKIKRKSR